MKLAARAEAHLTMLMSERFLPKCIDLSSLVSNASKTCFASVSRIGTSSRSVENICTAITLRSSDDRPTREILYTWEKMSSRTTILPACFRPKS